MTPVFPATLDFELHRVSGYDFLERDEILIPCRGSGFAGLAATRLGPAVADAPSKDEELQTSGVYGLVRHPIYFGDAFWPVGWSILFGAAYSLALTPLWFALLLVQSSLEERKLVEEHGEAYEQYREDVPYRIIPKVV